MPYTVSQSLTIGACKALWNAWSKKKACSSANFYSIDLTLLEIRLPKYSLILISYQSPFKTKGRKDVYNHNERLVLITDR